MIKISAMEKNLKISNADYIFDKSDKLLNVLPYLYKKILGDWYIVLLEPKPEIVRQFLDTEVIPEYVKLEIFMEPNQLEQLMLERPNMAIKKLSAWEKYQELIACTDILLDQKAVSEIYRRVGTNTKSLEEALNTLKEKVGTEVVTVKHVRLYIQDNSRVYTNQVVRAFLLDDKDAWKLFYIYEKELGEEIAFYAIRKYLRKLLKEKNSYLTNGEYKDRSVEQIDAFSIMRAFHLFETAKSHRQLIPILIKLQTKEDL